MVHAGDLDRVVDVVEEVLDRRLSLERPVPALAEVFDRDPEVHVLDHRDLLEDRAADRPELLRGLGVFLER